MKEVENFLGRKLKGVEKTIFDLFKDNSKYYFDKDESGNLRANKQKEGEPFVDKFLTK